MARREAHARQPEEQAHRSYALSRWADLLACYRFLDDGRLEIDNDFVERDFRPLALNRKNALFACSDGGAGHWATTASLLETFKLNDFEPYAYLADVIVRIVAGHPQSQIDHLLPWVQAPAPSGRGLRTALKKCLGYGADDGSRRGCRGHSMRQSFRRAGSSLKNRVSFNSASRIRLLKLSTKAFWAGLSGAMVRQAISFCSLSRCSTARCSSA